MAIYIVSACQVVGLKNSDTTLSLANTHKKKVFMSTETNFALICGPMIKWKNTARVYLLAMISCIKGSAHENLRLIAHARSEGSHTQVIYVNTVSDQTLGI